MLRQGRHEVTRRISMTTRKELVSPLQLRYGSATFGKRIRILDEFVALTGYHRKHTIRLLREPPGAAKGTPERNRLSTRQSVWSRRCCRKRPTGFAASG
jgi:hypothetical protein